MRTASQVPARVRFFLTQPEWITWQTTNIYRLINVRLASNSAAFIILCDATGQQHRFQLSKRASLELAAHMADVTEKLGYR
jgi:hypothetical protein